MTELDKFLATLQSDLRRADEAIAAGRRAAPAGKHAAAQTIELWKQWKADTTALLKHYGKLSDRSQH